MVSARFYTQLIQSFSGSSILNIFQATARTGSANHRECKNAKRFLSTSANQRNRSCNSLLNQANNNSKKSNTEILANSKCTSHFTNKWLLTVNIYEQEG